MPYSFPLPGAGRQSGACLSRRCRRSCRQAGKARQGWPSLLPSRGQTGCQGGTGADTEFPSELELAHNLDPAREERLQLVVDRFNKETGGSLKLVRLEKDQKPADLNLVTRYDMSEVITHPKSYVPLHEVMAKANERLNAAELSADLKGGVVDAKGRLVALPALYSTPVLFYNKNAFPQGEARSGAAAEDLVRDAGHARQAAGSGRTPARTRRRGRSGCISTTSARSPALPAVGDKGQPHLQRPAAGQARRDDDNLDSRPTTSSTFGRRAEASSHVPVTASAP